MIYDQFVCHCPLIFFSGRAHSDTLFCVLHPHNFHEDTEALDEICEFCDRHVGSADSDAFIVGDDSFGGGGHVLTAFEFIVKVDLCAIWCLFISRQEVVCF